MRYSPIISSCSFDKVLQLTLESINAFASASSVEETAQTAYTDPSRNNLNPKHHIPHPQIFDRFIFS